MRNLMWLHINSLLFTAVFKADPKDILQPKRWRDLQRNQQYSHTQDTDPQTHHKS